MVMVFLKGGGIMYFLEIHREVFMDKRFLNQKNKMNKKMLKVIILEQNYNKFREGV